ncbi:MAG: hypothetical protein ACN0LA_11210 [Candidatus Longimicrobiales bacterium M2_2A_002]
MVWYVIGGIAALLLGIYIGLGFPGLPGREDRVLPSGKRRRKKDYFTPLDLLRRDEKGSDRRRRGG